MKSKIVITFVTLCVFLCENSVSALSFSGPRVYVVTPSARVLTKDDGKATPFYYHNWMKRMDTGPDTTTTTTTENSSSKVKTPDLIFAEFESDVSKQKSIRKLLEKEKIQPKKITLSPIYVPDEEENKVTRVVNYGLPVKTITHNESSIGNNQYSIMSHNDHNSNVPAPVYVARPPMTTPTTTTKFTTTTLSPINIQNIWHVIDSEKSDKYSNKWEEISFESKNEEKSHKEDTDHVNEDKKNHWSASDENGYKQEYDDGEVAIDDNFALPGFATNPGNGAENESRAIRTEQNIRFPYVNLKPFLMKSKKPSVNNNIPNDKKLNLFTSLDNFYDLKNPVRGEAQDIVPISPPIDRYNPAQPYLPQQKYGSNLSKQSSPAKATASLVPPPPPPPPPPPNPTGNDFPAPTSYESFPPYAPSAPDFGPLPAPAAPPSPPVSMTPSKSVDVSSGFETSGPNPSGPSMETGYRYKPPTFTADSDDSAPVMDTGYHYKPPSAPTPQFYPTPVPPSKPFQGYSYNKPSMDSDTAPMTVAEKPEFQGYQYSKPVYQKPPVVNMPPNYGSLPTYGHDDFPPDVYEHDDSPPHIYDHDDTPHIEEDSDDEMSYGKKPYDDVKGGDDMKDDDMGMKPPSLHTDVKPGAYGPPPDDHGFPSDFPTDFKFPPDFNDHYHDHEHEHYHIVEHTTTTTTETPRVNRFSYYYLGKKLYYLPLYFSVYFIVYVGALIIKAVLRHKIVYPNSWRPNTTTATFFSKRSVDEYLSHENLHELTKKVTNAISTAAEKYMKNKNELS